jgi:hypothetical protein
MFIHAPIAPLRITPLAAIAPTRLVQIELCPVEARRLCAVIPDNMIVAVRHKLAGDAVRARERAALLALVAGSVRQDHIVA